MSSPYSTSVRNLAMALREVNALADESTEPIDAAYWDAVEVIARAVAIRNRKPLKTVLRDVYALESDIYR